MDNDNSLERQFQDYRREENVKARKADQKRAQKAKAETVQASKGISSKGEKQVDSRFEDERIRIGMRHFKNTSNHYEALRGARELLELLDQTNDPEKRATVRKEIWDEIQYELPFRASKAFLLQSIENIDALDGVIQMLHQDINTMIAEGKHEDTNTGLRDRMNALNSCEARKRTALEGRIEFAHPKELQAVISSQKTHVIAGSVLTVNPLPKGLIPEPETAVTLVVGNLPPGITKEAFASYFRRWGEINDIEKKVQLPLPRYNSISHELHMRSRQLISVLKQSKGEADKTSQAVTKMIALLENQELDQFFLRKLQAEVLFQAHELYGDEFNEESKTDRVSAFKSGGSAMAEKPQWYSDRIYHIFLNSFELLRVSLVVLPLIVLVVVGIATYSIRKNPAVGLELEDQAVVGSVVINVIQMVCVMAFAYVGMTLGRFGRDRPVQVLWLLDIMVLFIVSAIGMVMAQPWSSGTSERANYQYLVLVQAHALIALVAGVVEASAELLHAGHVIVKGIGSCLLSCGTLCCRCCCKKSAAKDSESVDEMSAFSKRFKRFRERHVDKIPVRPGRCAMFSFGTCQRTWRCVCCIRDCKRCKFSQGCQCADCCEILYAPGEAGTVAMKQDIIKQCNELNNEMNTTDYSQQDPGLHHKINRMRWRIKRLHLKIQYRQMVEEQIQRRPTEMETRDECYACKESFNWVRKEYHCKHCGYGFCQHCVKNVRRIPEMGYARAHVCDECAKKLTFVAEASKAHNLP